jgi:hypothetical protein
MLGGFLGSGKTTTLLRLAQQLQRAGKRVGIITNDQAAGLVDTALMEELELPVSEIAGGCFCCRSGSLVEALGKLTAASQPEVFLAEPVGSCTDLVATVSLPLERIYNAGFTMAPYAVLVDPYRAMQTLGVEELSWSAVKAGAGRVASERSSERNGAGRIPRGGGVRVRETAGNNGIQFKTRRKFIKSLTGSSLYFGSGVGVNAVSRLVASGGVESWEYYNSSSGKWIPFPECNITGVCAAQWGVNEPRPAGEMWYRNCAAVMDGGLVNGQYLPSSQCYGYCDSGDKLVFCVGHSDGSSTMSSGVGENKGYRGCRLATGSGVCVWDAVTTSWKCTADETDEGLLLHNRQCTATCATSRGHSPKCEYAD